MDNIEELASIFKALSDPTRLRLIKLLSGNQNWEDLFTPKES